MSCWRGRNFAALFLIVLAAPILSQEIDHHQPGGCFSPDQRGCSGISAPRPSPSLGLPIRIPRFLDKADVETVPASIPGDRSQVLAVFRLSGRGRVIDDRADGGSKQARRSALDAMKTWRFKPTLLNGLPIETTSCVVIDFAAIHVKAQAPKPRSEQRISRLLNAYCSELLEGKDPEVLLFCNPENRGVISQTLARGDGVSFGTR